VQSAKITLTEKSIVATNGAKAMEIPDAGTVSMVTLTMNHRSMGETVRSAKITSMTTTLVTTNGIKATDIRDAETVSMATIPMNVINAIEHSIAPTNLPCIARSIVRATSAAQYAANRDSNQERML